MEMEKFAKMVYNIDDGWVEGAHKIEEFDVPLQ